jgi:hypothetical protein
MAVILMASQSAAEAAFTSSLFSSRTTTVPIAEPAPPPARPSAPTEAIVFGDFNGDGRKDVAMGMPNYDVEPGLSKGVIQHDAGAIRIRYAAYAGKLMEDHPDVARELWNQNHLEGLTAEAGDRFGAALAAGDFNRDGYDDLAVGSPGEDRTLENKFGTVTLEDVGQVTILWGSLNGLTTLPSQWIQRGGVANDRLGTALAAGDFNRDSYVDLAVGVPGYNSGNGIVRVFHGAGYTDWASRNIVQQEWQLVGDPEDLDDTTGTSKQLYFIPLPLCCARSGLSIPRTDRYAFGSTLATGDFDGDGYTDLAAGAPRADVSSDNGYKTDAGAVSVIYGSKDGLSTVKEPRFLAQNRTVEEDDFSWFHGGIWTVSTRYVIGLEGRAEPDDRFGSSLAVGDFNGNGFDDLAVGVPYEGIWARIDHGYAIEKQRRDNVGAVNVVFGSPAGLRMDGNQIWHQYGGGVNHDRLPDDAEENDLFGKTLAAGDFTGDGLDDLAVGVPHEDLVGQVDAGIVHVLPGSNSEGLFATRSDPIWHHLAVGGAINRRDFFGNALGAGDINADGVAELAIAAPVPDSEGEKSVVHFLYGPLDPAMDIQSWYEATGF